MYNETKKSDLQLNKNILSESYLKINNNIDYAKWFAKNGNELEIQVKSNISIKKDDPSSALLVLGAHIFDENFLDDDKPFYCFVEMAFYFSDKVGNYTEEEPVASKFGLNMISIAYPYIRAYVSTLSAISGIEQIHMPTINVYETLNNLKDEPKE